MLRSAFTHSLRRSALISRRFASSASRATPVSRIGAAPKIAIGASLLAAVVLFPINQAQNDVQEQAKELAANAAEKVVDIKEEIIVKVEDAVDTEKKPEEAGEAGEPSEEQPAEGQAAFNPETGEINWDCPCLGGMAHGPCGEEFKEAFACFVYSETEPKGIDCIKKFEAMRTCFRQHPEHYKEELYEDEEVPSVDNDAEAPAADAAVVATEVVVDAAPSDGLAELTSEEVSAVFATPSEESTPASSEAPKL